MTVAFPQEASDEPTQAPQEKAFVDQAQEFLCESADKIADFTKLTLSGLCDGEPGVVRQSVRKLSDQVDPIIEKTSEFLKETFSGIFSCCDVDEQIRDESQARRNSDPQD